MAREQGIKTLKLMNRHGNIFLSDTLAGVEGNYKYYIQDEESDDSELSDSDDSDESSEDSNNSEDDSTDN